MPKIAIITDVHWSYKMGGTEYQVKLLLEKMCSNNDINLLYLSRILNNNYMPDRYRIEKIAGYNPLQKYALFIDGYSLYKKLKKFSPDTIYQRAGSAYTGIAAHYAKKHRCRFVFHVASDIDLEFDRAKNELLKPNKAVDDILLAYGIKNATSIIVQTNWQKRKLNKLLPKSDVKLIPNYHPTPKKNESQKLNQIIWVANLKELKQPELFILLARKLQKRNIDVNCFMAGAPTQYPVGYQEQIEYEIGKQKNLKYLGKLSVDAVNDMIAESKLLINTSKWEGFPNTFIQAWQRETPVVSLNVDPDDVLRKYKCGRCSKTFEKMLLDTIDLLSNDRARNQMGINAKLYVDRHHSMKNMDKLQNIIVDRK